MPRPANDIVANFETRTLLSCCDLAASFTADVLAAAGSGEDEAKIRALARAQATLGALQGRFTNAVGAFLADRLADVSSPSTILAAQLEASLATAAREPRS